MLLGSEALAQEWDLIGFPTLFVLRPDGTIAEAHVGPLTEESLREMVAPWLEAGP